VDSTSRILGVTKTKRKPATVGEILVEEFIQPMELTQAALAEAMGVQRKHVNELCNDCRNVTAATALILARVFGNSPDLTSGSMCSAAAIFGW
jgi:antitoxin HigA-1